MAAKLKGFKVTGRGQFPLDMLRYDGCWPARPEDVELMRGDVRSQPRTISLVTISHHAPTAGRWESFGWTVRTDLEA